MEGTVDYANFRAWVPRNVLPVGTLSPQDWVFYDWGPRGFDEPLLCLHPVLGSAESFYLQILALANRGYRVISPQLPVYWSAAEFCDALHTFLDMLGVRRVHLYGAGLGGFLALQFSARRPERVLSVALTHSFLSTSSVDHGIVYTPAILRWLPDFLVRGAIRGLCPSGPAPLNVAEAAEFVIRKTLESSREALSSRLALLVSEASVVGRLSLDEDRMTFIDAAEHVTASATGMATVEEAKNILPNARRALLKSGGDFPYLSSSEEIAMHLVVHLRRNAAPPLEPPPLPPPARARRVPSRRRRGRTSPPSSDNDSADDIPPDVTARAEEIVATSEAALVKQYAAEVANLRQYLPDRDDNFILSVLVDCEGNADSAVAKTRDGQYSKRFYEKRRRRALRAAKREIRASDRESAKVGATEETSEGGNKTSAASASVHSNFEDAANVAVSAVGVATQSDEQSLLASKGGTSIDSGTWRNELGEPNSSGALTLTSISGGETPASSAPGLGEMLDAEPVSDAVMIQNGERTNVSVRTPERKQSKKGWSRAKSARWKSVDQYPAETDSVAAYVTSARVGMRNESFVSRGPAPLPSSFPSYSTAAVNQADANPFADEATNASALFSSGPHANSTPGVAPPQARIQPLDLASSANRDSPHQASSTGGDRADATAVPPPNADDDDGWGAFRRMGLPSFGDDKALVGAKAAVTGGGTDASIDVGDRDDEALRLRDWAMSARTASESAQQRGV